MDRVGAVVGRGGDGLRAVTHRTGCRITVDARPGGGARLANFFRVASVGGSGRERWSAESDSPQVRDRRRNTTRQHCVLDGSIYFGF